jgi:hypothetical protein
MIQHLLEKLVSDHESALLWHLFYLLTTAVIFTAAGAFVCGKPGRSSWCTRATAVYTVVLVLPLLASLAAAFQLNLTDAWIDFAWVSVFTAFGFLAVEKDLAHRMEPRWIGGEYQGPGEFDSFHPEALGRLFLAAGKEIYSAFFRPLRKEEGYYPDDAGGGLQSLFSTITARFAKQA